MSVLTVVGYWFLWIVISFILAGIDSKAKSNLEIYVKYIYIQPLFIILIPLAVYFALPTHSIPFCIFLAGRIMYESYGVRDTMNIMGMSALQRHYGGIINFISWVLSLIGIIWGVYNLFVK